MSGELFEELNDGQTIKLKERLKELEGLYRNVFLSSDMGIEVLTDILVSLCRFASHIDDQYQMAEHNVGVNILNRMGILTPNNRINVIRSVVSAIPTPTKEE